MRTPATKPILFSEPMVRAILDGRKTMTRRIIKGVGPYDSFEGMDDDMAVTAVDRYGEEYPKSVPGLYATFVHDGYPEFSVIKAYCEPGDLLWVRETWAYQCCYWHRAGLEISEDGYVNRAVDSTGTVYGTIPPRKWRPSIHMPKEAARLFLRVKNVRMERIQDISAADAVREGCAGDEDLGQWWDSLLKPADLDKYGWFANPWVWVIAFERVPKPESWPET